MKRLLCILLVTLIAFGTAAYADSAVVTFSDPMLEAMIRATLGKPTGDITQEEAQAVTRLDLSIEWQRYVSSATPIQDIRGLESFTNLESLDLTLHEITDITPLAGLKNLTGLWLGSNPIADLSPLSGLENLKGLTLSGCAAQDYSPLADLVNLNLLVLEDSTLTDVSPLAALTNLKYLYLAGCSIGDYSPLLEIYRGLTQKDFSIAFSLSELGFYMDDRGTQAIYDGERASIRINHAQWGDPPSEWMRNCVRTVFARDDYKVDIGYYPDVDAYVMMAAKDGNMVMNYVYGHSGDSFTFGLGDRESSEQTVRAIFGEADDEDPLLTPVRTFQELLAETVSASVATLFEMPFEPLTLNSLGFVFDETNGTYVYAEKEPRDMHLSLYRQEWGGTSSDGCDLEFYDDDMNGYHLLVLYFADEDKYHVALFRGDMDCAFDFYAEANEYGWEYPDMETVHQMFGAAFKAQGNEIYPAPLTYFDNAVLERFNMAVDELLSLPVSE